MQVFLFIMAVRSATALYYFIFMIDFGRLTLTINTESESPQEHRLLRVLYFFKFLDDCFNYVICLFFYNLVHIMYNYWDELFKENVEIEMQMEDDEGRFVNLMHDRLYAAKQIQRNQAFRKCFNIFYSVLSVAMLTAQLVFVFLDNKITPYIQLAAGLMLLLLDLLMIYRLVVSLNRIILLTADSTWTVVWQHLILVAISLIFLIRALCEDLDRTGSQLPFFITGYNYDQFLIETELGSVFWLTDNKITRINHNIFPFVTGIVVATFKFLSTGEFMIGDDNTKPAMEEVEDVDKPLKMSINMENNAVNQNQDLLAPKQTHRISISSIQQSISSYQQLTGKRKPSDNTMIGSNMNSTNQKQAEPPCSNLANHMS